MPLIVLIKLLNSVGCYLNGNLSLGLYWICVYRGDVTPSSGQGFPCPSMMYHDWSFMFIRVAKSSQTWIHTGYIFNIQRINIWPIILSNKFVYHLLITQSAFIFKHMEMEYNYIWLDSYKLRSCLKNVKNFKWFKYKSNSIARLIRLDTIESWM